MIRLQRLAKWQLQILLVLAALLIALRLALPMIVKHYVNKTLDEMPGYHGHVEDINMKLWRGAYEIRTLKIVKTSGKVPVPFFSAPKIEFSVQWKALFQGALVARIYLDSPDLNFVKGPTDATSQVGVDKPWFDVIKKLFPLDINYCEARNGSIHYKDFYSDPKIDLTLDQIHLVATNLTNSAKLSKTLVATLSVDGRMFGESRFVLHSKIDPWKDKATFDLDFHADPFPLKNLNDFAEAYGKFHFEKGTLTITAELAASDGQLTGYVKPLFDDIGIIDLKEDIKNPLKLAWESVVAGISHLFRNQPKDRFATKIPISGTFSDPKAQILPALGNILKNEFIRAYNANFENSISLENAQKAEQEKPEPQVFKK